MGFLDFMKKKGELPADIDLDMPPEPPKMMMDEISAERPIDEELIPRKGKLKVKAKVKKEPELPEIPPLPEMEEDMPPLPKMEEDLGELPEEKNKGFDLPPPPMEKKKGLFSFLKPKKTAKKLSLPELGMDIPEMPPLPEMKGEFPEMPSMPEEHDDFSRLPPLPKQHISEEDRYAPKFEREMPIKAPVELPEIHAEPLKPKVEPIRPPVEEPIIKEPIQPIVEEHVHREEVPQVKRKKFITIDNFRQVQDSINSTKNTLKGVDGFFTKLGEVKHEGDTEYAGLRSSLRDIQSKIVFVDKVLFRE
jgi:hypothetical protein